ncbi:MAG TPA: transcriptional regulator NrdR [Acidimicrobiia bacterium]|nr:transcriptional regulator NrdR [Acidimicrobiia bacterium]
MRCPVCGAAETKVIDSRPAEGGAAIRRRRLCAECGSRFTTYERGTPVLMVKKRSGLVETFSTEKLTAGVMAAVAGRSVSASAVADLVEEIETEVAAQPGPFPSQEIGRLVLEGLRKLDEVAYLRFASVYKDFQHAEDFEREMAALGEKGSGTGQGGQ